MTAERREVLVLANDDALSSRTSAFADTIVRHIAAALPAEADIVHVGATAVPGCMTKGDVDIVVRVKADDFRLARTVLSDLFETNAGSAASDTFAAFQDEDGEIPLGVQLVVMGSELDGFHLFAAHLRDSKADLAAYNSLKRRFEGQDMNSYRAAKALFVAAILEKAGGRSNLS